MIRNNRCSMSYEKERQRLMEMAKCHLGFVDSEFEQAIKDYLKKEGW